jgi:histidine phosphotransferase ChpT
MQIDSKAAQLLCSRICHDIIGPVGAVNTGLELLAEGGPADDEALALMSDSAQQVARRLAYFRVAFGSGGGSGPSAVSNARDLALALVSGGKISIDWDAADAHALDGQIAADSVKLLLVMIFLAVESLPRGGSVFIHTADLADGIGIAVTAAGTGARLREGMAAALIGSADVDELTAHSIIAHFAGCLAERMGITVECADGDDEVRLAALLPPATDGIE